MKLSEHIPSIVEAIYQTWLTQGNRMPFKKSKRFLKILVSEANSQYAIGSDIEERVKIRHLIIQIKRSMFRKNSSANLSTHWKNETK